MRSRVVANLLKMTSGVLMQTTWNTSELRTSSAQVSSSLVLLSSHLVKINQIERAIPYRSIPRGSVECQRPGPLEFARKVTLEVTDSPKPGFSRLLIGLCRKPRLRGLTQGRSWPGAAEWRVLATPLPSAALPGPAPFPVERWRPPQVDRSCCCSTPGAAAGAPAAAER